MVINVIHGLLVVANRFLRENILYWKYIRIVEIPLWSNFTLKSWKKIKKKFEREKQILY